MSLEYDFYANPPSWGSDRKPKLHARVKTRGTTTTQKLAELIEHTTSLSTADIKAALDALAGAVAFELTAGRRVHLHGLGYFGLSLSCPPIDSPKEIRAESVKFKNIVFRPDVEWKEQFRGVELEKARDKNHSLQYSEIEVDGLLTAHFLDNPYITASEFRRICGFTPTTGSRRIKQLIEDGKLRRVTYGNATMYEPVPGNYRR